MPDDDEDEQEEQQSDDYAEDEDDEEDNIAIPIDQTESATDENYEQSGNINNLTDGTTSSLMENAYEVKVAQMNAANQGHQQFGNQIQN